VTTHVIILAQGAQTRLPMFELPHTPKQLVCLQIPVATGIHKYGVSILTRTLRQLALLLANEVHVTTVVGWPSIAEHYAKHPVIVSSEDGQTHFGVGTRLTVRYMPEFVSLPDPGNSSLRGLGEYFDLKRERTGTVLSSDRCVVLLGDVVYSWDCMRMLLDPAAAIRFVGTSDLSTSGGELWGIAWDTSRTVMLETLREALARHPKVDDVYQCGQMRRWWWAVRDVAIAACLPAEERGYMVCDDYTFDLDKPADIRLLSERAPEVEADDRRNGVTW
jgi:hypothetical protein